MQLQRTTRSRVHPIKLGLSVALCLCVLLLSFLAAGIDLHGLWHDDAHEEEHQCAISLFAHGKVDFADTTPVYIVPVRVAVLAAHPTVVVLLLTPDFQLPPERGPPAHSVPTFV